MRQKMTIQFLGGLGGDLHGDGTYVRWRFSLPLPASRVAHGMKLEQFRRRVCSHWCPWDDVNGASVLTSLDGC